MMIDCRCALMSLSSLETSASSLEASAVRPLAWQASRNVSNRACWLPSDEREALDGMPKERELDSLAVVVGFDRKLYSAEVVAAFPESWWLLCVP